MSEKQEMKQIQVKATIGEVVWFMLDNKITSSTVYGIELYNNVCWYKFFKKPKVIYKFYRRNDDYILRNEDNIFLSKEELLTSLGDKFKLEEK